MQRLVEQTRVIRDLLKKMDDVVLPRYVASFVLEREGKLTRSVGSTS